MIPLEAIIAGAAGVTGLAVEAVTLPGRAEPRPLARRLVVAVATRLGHGDAAIAASLNLTRSMVRHHRSSVRRRSKLPTDWARQMEAVEVMASVAALPEVAGKE